jgi:hypothetical protein
MGDIWLSPPGPSMCPECGTKREGLKVRLSDIPLPRGSAQVADQEHKFVRATDFDRSYQTLPNLNFHEKLRDVAKAFNENIFRATSPIRFTLFLAARVSADQFCTDAAMATQGIRWPVSWVVKVSKDDPKFDAFSAEKKRIFESLWKFWNSLNEEWRGRKLIDSLLVEMHHSRDPGLQPMLANQVIGVWTAFETLAVDLWVASLNAMPTLAAAVVTSLEVQERGKTDGKKHEEARGADDEDDEEPSEYFDVKNVPFWKLWKISEHTFDLSNSMGTLLKPRFRFGRMAGISKAYTAAFGDFLTEYRQGRERAVGVDVAKAEEAGEERLLNTLYAVRNVMTHRAGFPDKLFFDRIGENNPIFPNIQKDRRLPLDGEQVLALTNVVVKRGVFLLELANKVLTDHPRKAKT